MRKALVIYNPAAGRFPVKPFLKAIETELVKAGWRAEIVATQSGEHAVQLGRQAAAESYEAAFAVGGDGTVGQVASGLLGSETALGVLPAGTSNVWATSTSKYKRLKNCTSEDGRIRGTIQFSGAQRTRRDAGRNFQPQNLPRPDMKTKEIEEGIEALKGGYADILFENVMRLCANALRGCIVAAPGHKLVIADLSNIEGRVAAWLTGEEWKLQAFLENDSGTGEDLYKLAYAKAFNISPQQVKDGSLERQIGKVMELMLQYEGGVGAFLTGAATYRIDLEDMARKALPNMPQATVAEATKFYEFKKESGQETYDLSKEVFVACDGLKRLWRAKHPAIAGSWRQLADAFRMAVAGHSSTVGRLEFQRHKNWVRLLMPSGASVCYPGASVDSEGNLRYWGVNSFTRKWGRLQTYGGKLLENATQACSRDVFKHGQLAAEHAGYKVILPVHDENLTEVPDKPEYSAEGLSELMSHVPWADGLPISAKGFETYRYRKG